MQPSPNMFFGRIALKMGLLTATDLRDLLREKSQRDKVGVPISIGELCQMRGLLTSGQVHDLLRSQDYLVSRSEDRRLGALVIANGLAGEDTIQRLLARQKEVFRAGSDAVRLGQLLIGEGVVSEKDLCGLLAVQERLDRSDTKEIPPPQPRPAPPADLPRAQLVQVAGDGLGRVVPMGVVAVLGRNPFHEIPIAGGGVSRQHARIDFDPARVGHVVCDLTSRNGTFVNDVRIEEPVVLRSGDRIRVGEAVFRYDDLGSGASELLNCSSERSTSEVLKSETENSTGAMPMLSPADRMGPRTSVLANRVESRGDARPPRPSPLYERARKKDSRAGLPDLDGARRVYRPNQAIRLPPNAPRATGRVVCPHCWHEFKVEDTLFIAAHPDLLGDPVLGPEAPRRFPPSRFTPSGNALDAEKRECPDRACPRCHLRLPLPLYQAGLVIVSVVGAPSSGKTYLLTSMMWELRRALPVSFHLYFSDADAVANAWLNSFEECLFLATRPQTAVYLRKTDLQGETYCQIVLDGAPMSLPRPSLFSLRLMEGHPRATETAGSLSRNLVFYDNAGEHFQPGMDTESHPGTQHLLRSNAIFFLFDPTLDARFRARMGERTDRVRPEAGARQETLLGEMIQRIVKRRGPSSNGRVDTPLLVLLTKFDAWADLLPGDLPEAPYRWSRGASTAGLDVDVVATVSLAARQLLFECCPQVVWEAERFSRNVHYIPVSALGHEPSESGEGAIVVRPVDVKPWWVSVPLLFTLAQFGLVPILEPTSPDPTIPEAVTTWAQEMLVVRVPETDVQHTLPASFAGMTVRCPSTGRVFRIPGAAFRD
ncbi:MAG: FHA domain-containing protein [Planctomycetes bacterium]|nr:FHA domain-containing protein [Planctomycetota bacterium]